MKCRRCAEEDIINYQSERKCQTGYYCENCGATYVLIDDSGE